MAVIRLEGLTKDYGEVLANDDVSFEVERGEIFGYLGPNGAGKTTTIRTLLGFISPTSGTGQLLGHDITDESAYSRRNDGLATCPTIQRSTRRQPDRKYSTSMRRSKATNAAGSYSNYSIRHSSARSESIHTGTSANSGS